MAKMVAEFMQKPVKKYACGKRAEQAKKTLMNAFVASSQKKAVSEKAQLEKMIDIVNKTPTGRETLKNLSKAGCSIHFDGLEGMGGFFSPGKNKLVINRNMSLESMAILLVHEGTHAVQWYLKGSKDFAAINYSAADVFRNGRAKEADAYAHQTAFSYECKTAYPVIYQMIMEKNPHLSGLLKTYEGEMEKSGDSEKAMQKTFTGWYENVPMMNSYDNNYKTFVTGWLQEDRKGLFQKELSDEVILKQLRHNGKKYVSEDFLKSGIANSIRLADKQEIYAAMIGYARKVGERADLSVLKMNDRTEDGKLIPPRNKAAKTAVVSKLRQKSR